MSDHKFQINLRGIIDLLSNHLYSGPRVYVRELLQNSVDAITARQTIEPGWKGEITLDVAAPRGSPPTLVVEDNGIGLTEEEVHRFLATIGASSKRDELGNRRGDFIGQFGIGLLSCFIVSDEIVLITRSATGSKAIEWRGRADGTYAFKTLDQEMAPGTRVYLRCRKGSEEWFGIDRVRELAADFGGLLPHPIKVGGTAINAEPPPWRRPGVDRGALLDYGESLFATRFFDAIPLRSSVGDVDGVAFVLPYTASLATKNSHRIYLKNMLLSESGEHVLPTWAFFVKAVVNANDLRPTASREAFYEDEALEATREALGQCLREWLMRLAATDRRRLDRLISLHHLPIKALALEDDEFFKLFIDHLPFETSMGTMTLKEYLKSNDSVRFVRTVDHFRQISRVAAAQSECVINGGYVYDADLLEKYGELHRKTPVEAVDPAELAQGFEEVSLEERDLVHGFLKTADEALKPFRCSAEVRTFKPAELPALYSTSADEDLRRSIDLSREVADEHWSGVLGNLQGGREGPSSGAELCFNFTNPLVRKLAGVRDKKLVKQAVQMLYVQALLLGHHPLRQKEMGLLGEGLLALIERAAGSP